MTITLAGIPITLRDARIAATYVGNPATTTTNGLLMGFISEADGAYAFPSFLHAPDAMFAVSKLLELLSRSGKRVSEVFREIPPFAYQKIEVPCPVDKKGLAMRRMSEDSVDKEATFIDGVQVALDGQSVLLLPDPHKPCLHLVVEGPEAEGQVCNHCGRARYCQWRQRTAQLAGARGGVQ